MELEAGAEPYCTHILNLKYMILDAQRRSAKAQGRPQHTTAVWLLARLAQTRLASPSSSQRTMHSSLHFWIHPPDVRTAGRSHPCSQRSAHRGAQPGSRSGATEQSRPLQPPPQEHAPCWVQFPRCEQAFRQPSEQSDPEKPGRQTHVPFTQMPLPEQRRGHVRRSQRAPLNPAEQRHSPATHTPCPASSPQSSTQ